MRMANNLMNGVRVFLAAALLFAASVALPARAGENLKLNAHLDYSSDSNDGPLITGDHMDEAVVSGKPNYIIFTPRRVTTPNARRGAPSASTKNFAAA